jgi:hypothetical protein
LNILNLFDFKPKMKDFAAELLRALARAGISGWSLGPDSRSLIHATHGVMNLVNLHNEYVNARRAERPVFLRKYVELAKANFSEVPRDWATARAGIRAVVRSRFDYTVLDIDHRQNPWPSTVIWPFVGDLCVRLVHDFGVHVSHVTRERMSAWGQSEETVRHVAIENLGLQPKPEWLPLGAGVYQLRAEEYSDSLLLLNEVIDELPFKDSPVVIPCNRGVLLAADAASASAVCAMIELASRYQQQKPWPLGETLCTRVQGEWREFDPSSEVLDRANDLRIQGRASIYQDQKTALERHHQKIGKDVFVATFGVTEHDGRFVSWCSWMEGVATLLPKTDQVAFRSVRDPQQITVLNWKDVVAHAGMHLQETTEDPPRFFVNSFPDDAEWRVLDACAVRRVSAD